MKKTVLITCAVAMVAACVHSFHHVFYTCIINSFVQEITRTKKH